jgi:Heterokaryon incompatibility protein (HET)
MASIYSEPVFINFYTPENGDFYSANLYKALNPNNDDFRLIEILPGQILDRVKCRIIQPPETFGVKYECISYRAGDPTEILEIEVDGHPFNAFASLGAALRKLRQLDRNRIVWADQICINQYDIAERGSQVSKMRIFYERAECVVAWLGVLKGGDIAFSTMKDIQHEFEAKKERTMVDGLTFNFEPILSSVANGIVDELLSDDPDAWPKYEAFGNLFRSDLWSRLWIWQELIVANTIQLEWETHSVKIEDLWIVFQILQRLTIVEWPLIKPKSFELLIGNNPTTPASKVFEILKIRTRRGIWQEQKVLPLDRLLDSARRAFSTDPRDRVFALCGLSDPKLGIVPDYQATIQQVYTATATAIMERERSLDILAYCKHSRITKAMALPTWCPDWSSQLDVQAGRIPLLFGEFPAECKFRASKSTYGGFHVVPKELETGVWLHTSLFAQGVTIGTVRSVETFETADQRTNEDKFQYLLSSWAERTTELEIFGEGALHELEKTVLVDNRGFATESSLSRAIFEKNSRELKFDVINGLRRFIVTSNGLMGMAPPHVQEGDLACVLLGARVPFILRKCNEFHTLIGEVYISSGYMYGRAIDDMEVGKTEAQGFEIR